MGFNCLDADVHALGDEPVIAALSDILDNLEFAVAQEIDAGSRFAVTALGDLLEHLLADPVAHMDFILGDLVQGGQENLRAFVFHDVTQGPGSQRSFCVEEFLMEGIAEDSDFGVLGPKHAQQIKAVYTIQGDVQNADAGLSIPDDGQSGLCIRGGPADLEIILTVDKDAKAFQQDRMIIDEEDSDGRLGVHDRAQMEVL